METTHDGHESLFFRDKVKRVGELRPSMIGDAISGHLTLDKGQRVTVACDRQGLQNASIRKVTYNIRMEGQQEQQVRDDPTTG